MLDKLGWQDLIERAAWTALEGFLATFAVLAPGILMAPNLATAKALGVSAVAAGVAAAISAVKTYIKTALVV